MVRPSGRGGDGDLGPVTDRTGRVEGRTVTASSRGVRGRDSTSDLPATPTHLGFHHGTGEPGSFAQPPAIPFRSRPPLQPHLFHTPMPYEPYRSTQLSSHPTNTPIHVAPVAHSSGSDGRPRHGKGKGLTDSFMPVMSLAEGDPVDPELIPSYGGHVAGPIWREQDRGSLKFRSSYMALTSWELTDGHVRPLASRSMLGYKNENKLLDIRLRLDVMTTDEPQEARRPPNNRMYVLMNTFTWNSVPAIPPSSCTDNYMGWYLPRSHPSIQNPENIPSGFHLLVAPVMPPQALLDLIAREATREDLEDSEFRRMVRDLLRKHYRAP
ncbi:hypothetical protein M9H77_05212 [Catharanthus roseus]|uniref:Uncharacterized protein n=1 Tax=Catharanthus roseus TaxID=4058 RepID=A0ACC0CGQ8_CATRO|nr:hypothetical protein M9H77_05212 [Catharanthus roseus]